MEIEALATAHDRRQNFLRFSRRENEFHVGWRLLQRFQKRVERGRGEHVHFVDDINFVARFGWRVRRWLVPPDRQTSAADIFWRKLRSSRFESKCVEPAAKTKSENFFDFN